MGEMLVRHEPATASAVRRRLALDLEFHGVDADVLDDITLVASELIGNAIRHASNGDSDSWAVTWTVTGDDVVISVEDPSAELPVRRRAAPEACNGRGLAIVETISSDWGVELTDRGKRVWARVPCAA
jgi:anti-sigma regulatory factor (Ser/Thr protein kinase)